MSGTLNFSNSALGVVTVTNGNGTTVTSVDSNGVNYVIQSGDVH